jgi:membrane associated rhomboid family serine protease
MLPIKDTIRARSFSIVNWTLITVNVLVFLLESSLSPQSLEQMINTYALVPAHLSVTNPATWLPLITHMFMHGSWLHLLSNMWILLIFGDNVEDRLGKGGYLFFYLVGGVAAGVLQVILGGDPNLPSLGASGAIAAVMGAYFLFYPRAKILTFVPLILIWFIQLPAWVYLGIWFGTQLYSGLSAIALQSGGSTGGIAWWAHIGGFAFGLFMALTSGRKPQNPYPGGLIPGSRI